MPLQPPTFFLPISHFVFALLWKKFIHRLQQRGQVHQGRTTMHHHRHKTGFDHVVAAGPGLDGMLDMDGDAPFALCPHRQAHVVDGGEIAVGYAM
jgi:hypothetical protein